MFTLAMFKNDQAGALAAAKYYIDADNWSAATNTNAAVRAICTAKTCLTNNAYLAALRKEGRHIAGARDRVTKLSIFRSDDPARADMVARVTLVYAAGRIVDSKGATVKKAAAMSEGNDIYLRWNGHRWIVVNLYLSP